MSRGLFTEETLTKVVGEDGRQELKQAAIDSGQAFLSGGVTNLAYKLTTSNTGQALVNTTTTALGTYAFGSQLVDNAEEIITTLSFKIADETVTIITTEVGKIVGYYVGNHTAAIASWPGKVQSYAMAYFNDHKESIGDVLKRLTESAESRLEKEDENSKKSTMSKFISKMKTKINSVTSDINKYTSIANSYIQMASSYIANGDDWVIDQIDKQLSSLADSIDTKVNEQWLKDKKVYDESAKKAGDAIGIKMTEKYNQELQAAQDKMLKKIENNKSKAAAKAFAAIGKNKAKIASMTGIYIP